MVDKRDPLDYPAGFDVKTWNDATFEHD